jgi:hypothetical protein
MQEKKQKSVIWRVSEQDFFHNIYIPKQGD